MNPFDKQTFMMAHCAGSSDLSLESLRSELSKCRPFVQIKSCRIRMRQHAIFL